MKPNIIIFLALIFNMTLNIGFIAFFTNSTDVVAFCPKGTSPEGFFHTGDSFEYFSGSNAFYCPNYFCRTIRWN